MTAFLNPLKLLPINNLFQRKSVPPPKREIFCFCARDNQGPQDTSHLDRKYCASQWFRPGDGIATFTQNHGYSITSDDVYAHAGVLGQGDVGRVGAVSGGDLQKYQSPC